MVDTQIVVAIKHRLKVNEQYQTLRYLDRLIEAGWLTFPKQVARELEVAEHPDGPGIWAVDAKRRRRYAEPSDESMADVLGVAPGLLDPNEERNQADPYVVALAYELRERFPDVRVCVATENTRDRAPLQSPGTACELLGIERLDFEAFLEWLPDVDEDGAPLTEEPTLLNDRWALGHEEQVDAERVAAERHDSDEA